MDNSIKVKITTAPQSGKMHFEYVAGSSEKKEEAELSKARVSEALKLVESAFSRHAKLADLKEAGTCIHRHFLPVGLKTLLRQKDIAGIQFLIDPGLFWIPFELAYDGINFFFNSYACAREALPGNSADKAVTLSYPIRVGIIADPTGDLPSASAEAEMLRKKLSLSKGSFIVDVIAGSRVTEKRFAEFFQSHDIIHYAGHVEKKPVPAFKLSDTTLPAEVIAKYEKFPFLFFANACHAVKMLEGPLADRLFGFIGTFSEAEDASSPDLAMEIYRHIAGGIRIARALSMVRSELYRKLGGRDLTWANYFYYGDLSVRIIPSELMEDAPGFESYSKALACFRHHEYSGVEDQCMQAREEGYHRDLTHTLAGVACFLQGNDEKTLKHLKTAVQLNPRNGKARFWLGKFYKHTGQGRDCEYEYQKVFECHYDALTSALLFKEKKADKLISKKIYSKTLEALIDDAIISLRQSFNLDNKLGLALLFSMNDEPEKAVAELKGVLEQDAQYIDACYYLSDEYIKIGRTNEALEMLNLLKELDEKNIEIYRGLGRLYYTKGMYNECVEAMEQGLMHATGDAAYHFNLGIALCASDEKKKGMARFRTAVTLDPELAQAWYNMAVICQEEKKTEQAFKYYRSVLTIDPRNYHALNNYGILLAEEGLFKDSRKYLEKAALTACEQDSDACENPFANLEVLTTKQLSSIKAKNRRSITKEVLIAAGILFLFLLYFIVTYLILK